MSSINFESLKEDAIKQIRIRQPDFRDDEMVRALQMAQDSFRFVRSKANELRGMMIDNLVVDKEMNELPGRQLKELETLTAQNFTENLGVSQETAQRLVHELYRSTSL